MPSRIRLKTLLPEILVEDQRALLDKSKDELIVVYTRIDNIKKNLPNDSEDFTALGDVLQQVLNAARSVQEVEKSMGQNGGGHEHDHGGESQEPSEEPKVREADIYGGHHFGM